MGKPASGIMEASLSYLGFFSECVETYAPTTIITGDEPAAHASAEPSAAVFSGRYCLGSVRLPNATLVELQVRITYLMRADEYCEIPALKSPRPLSLNPAIQGDQG